MEVLTIMLALAVFFGLVRGTHQANADIAAQRGDYATAERERNNDSLAGCVFLLALLAVVIVAGAAAGTWR